MNLPFSPTYLWPVPVVLLALGIAYDRRRRRLPGCEVPPHDDAALATLHRLKNRPLATVAGAVLAVVAALDLAYFSVAPVAGKVVDREGGAPIAGATVKRRLYRVGGWRLGDGPGEHEVGGSRVETRTGADGSFVLPGWVSLWPSGLQGLCGMGWMVHEPAHMPAYGCLRDGLHAWGAGWLGCGAFNMPMDPDPWVKWAWQRTNGSEQLVVSTAVKTQPDAWAEAFGRASRLLDGDWIELSGYVEEATGYAKTHEISEEMVEHFYSLAIGLGGYDPNREDFVRVGVAEGGALIKLVADYCKANLHSKTCTRWRVGIELEIAKFRMLGGLP